VLQAPIFGVCWLAGELAEAVSRLTASGDGGSGERAEFDV